MLCILQNHIHTEKIRLQQQLFNHGYNSITYENSQFFQSKCRKRCLRVIYNY